MSSDYPKAKNVGLTNECAEALKTASEIRDKSQLFLMREYIEAGAKNDIENYKKG